MDPVLIVGSLLITITLGTLVFAVLAFAVFRVRGKQRRQNEVGADGDSFFRRVRLDEATRSETESTKSSRPSLFRNRNALIALGAALLAVVSLMLVVNGRSEPKLPEPIRARVGIWEPAAAAAAAEYQRIEWVVGWHQVLPRAVEVETSTELALLEQSGLRVVVVANAHGLTDSEASKLIDFMERGGSVIITGWIGGDDKKKRRSTTVMQRLLQVRHVTELPRKESYFLTAATRGPLSSGVLPGQRLSFDGFETAPAIENPQAELVWSDWGRSPRRPAAGASRRVSFGAGRLVWLAVPPAHVGGSEIASLYRNAFHWANREPVAEVWPWPNGAPFAGLLAMDTEDQFANADSVTREASQRKYPITFFVLTELAARYPRLVEEMAEVGEIASHADIHDGFRDLAEHEQRTRLESSKGVLAKLGYENVRGFRAPHESYDGTTLRALAATGFGYMAGDLESQSMVPRIVSTSPPFVQIPRTSPDDYHLIVKHKLNNDTMLREEILSHIARSQRYGGLYYFSFHSQIFGTPQRLATLSWLADELTARGAWITTGSELASWWVERARARAELIELGVGRVRMKIYNYGRESSGRLCIRVRLNRPVQEIMVAELGLFKPTPKTRFEKGKEFVDLLLPELSGGATRTYDVEFTPLIPAKTAEEIDSETLAAKRASG